MNPVAVLLPRSSAAKRSAPVGAVCCGDRSIHSARTLRADIAVTRAIVEFRETRRKNWNDYGAFPR
jgi:hypothetical protein